MPRVVGYGVAAWPLFSLQYSYAQKTTTTYITKPRSNPSTKSFLHMPVFTCQIGRLNSFPIGKIHAKGRWVRFIRHELSYIS